MSLKPTRVLRSHRAPLSDAKTAESPPEAPNTKITITTTISHSRFEPPAALSVSALDITGRILRSGRKLKEPKTRSSSAQKPPKSHIDARPTDSESSAALLVPAPTRRGSQRSEPVNQSTANHKATRRQSKRNKRSTLPVSLDSGIPPSIPLAPAVPDADTRRTNMAPPLRPKSTTKPAPHTPARNNNIPGYTSEPVSVSDTPMARSSDSKQIVSGMAETPRNLVCTNKIIADNFGRYEDGVISEHEGLIDAVYPRLDQFLGRFLQENYDSENGEWKRWPSGSSEKDVSEWFENLLQNLEGYIREAGEGDTTEKAQNSPVVVSSRIIKHGSHPMNADDNTKKNPAKQKPDLVFIDNKSTFLCRKGIKINCTCKGVVCHCVNPAKCTTSPDTTKSLSERPSERCKLPNLRWNHIRAFAELKSRAELIGKISGKNEIICTMANRARQLFYHQPTRTHLHCFALGGHYLRCYLITRSGIVASNAFSIHKQPQLALRVFSAFFCGDLDWYGLKTDYYVKIVRGDKVLRVPYDCSSRMMERIDPYYDVTDEGPTLVVDVKDPVCRRFDLVSRGTVFFRARHPSDPSWYWGMGIKEAWRIASRDAEGDLLRKVSRESPNIARYMHHKDVTSTTEIRNWLDLEEGNRVTVKDPFEFGKSGPKVTSGKKRTSGQAGFDDTGGLFGKRIKSETAIPEEQVLHKIEVVVQEETDAIVTTSKRSATKKRKSSQTDGEVEERALKRSRSEPLGPKEEEPSRHGAEDRILGRLVLDSFGRELASFQTTEELLRGIHSALLGHRNLYDDCNILHRDISNGNILLPWPSNKKAWLEIDAKVKERRKRQVDKRADVEEEQLDDESLPEDIDGDRALEAEEGVGEPESWATDGTHIHGTLIDLDYSIDNKRDKSSGARLRTGTTVFMAIELLMGGAKNSYFHDLHSFFYVLLLVLTEHNQTDFKSSQIYKWMEEKEDQRLASLKGFLLVGNQWRLFADQALKAWASESQDYNALKKLLEDWRDKCFPFDMSVLSRRYSTKDFEGLGKGWDTEMYNGMVVALEEAIKMVQGTGQNSM